MHILLAFLQDAPAETTNYMFAGYAVILIVLALYLFSIALRSFRLHQELEMLQEEDEG